MEEPLALGSGLSRATPSSVTAYGYDLVTELMGEVDFGSMTYLALTGELPSPAQARLVNAMLVTLVEHGLTPSTIAARMTHLGAPEALQGAVAAGLLGLGSMFVGSIGQAASMLRRAALSAGGASAESVAEEIVASYRHQGSPLPGLGHPLHRPVDPRAERLFQLAQEEGLYGGHCHSMRLIQQAAERRTGHSLPVNATGAIAAVGLEVGLGEVQCRGLGIIARSVGLIAHIAEENKRPIARDIWRLVESGPETIGPRDRA